MSKLTILFGGKRNATAFEAFMRPYFRVLYARAHRLAGNPEDAEDLVQDLCVRVFPRLAELEKVDDPQAWLMRVLYRLFVDMARARKRSPLRAISAVESEDTSLTMASTEPGPEDRVDAIQAGRRLRRAWRHLSREEQALLALHGIEGHSLKELEQITGLAQGTLKSRLHRARVKLGRLIEREKKEIAFSLSMRGPKDELPGYRRSVG